MKRLALIAGLVLTCLQMVKGQVQTNGEYFFDTDPGQGSGYPLSGSHQGDSIDFQAAIPVTGLAPGFHNLLIRFQDTTEHWGSPQQKQFYVLGEANRAPRRAGLGRAEMFFDNDDPGVGLATPVLGFTPGDSVDLLRYVPVRGLGYGSHTITFRVADSLGKWSGHMRRSFIVGAPVASRCTPRQVGNTGQATLTITGFGFTDSTQVRLLSASGSISIAIPDSSIKQENGSNLTAIYNFSGRDTGVYNIELTFRGRRDTVILLGRALRIVDGTLPDVSAKVLANSLMRNHTWTPFNLVLHNNGNIDAKAVPVFIMVPENADVKWNNVTPYLEGLDSIALDSLGRDFSYVIIDSAFGTTNLKAKGYWFTIPLISANEDYIISFQIFTNSPFLPKYYFRTWTLAPMIGASLANPNGRNSLSLGCIADLFNNPCYKAVAAIALKAMDESLNAAILDPINNCAYNISTNAICDAVSLAINYNKPGAIKKFIIDRIKHQVAGIYKCLDAANPLKKFSTVFKAANALFTLIDQYDKGFACGKYLSSSSEDNRSINEISSIDPNIKIGISGIGRLHYLSANDPTPYLIRFENKDSATAPAQTVTILDTLDRNVFDPSTLELGFVGFGDTMAIPPRGLNAWSIEVGLNPLKPYTVRIEANYNDTTGVLRWDYRTLSSSTLLPITDPLGGFLPPNITPPQGEGGVFFTIGTKPGIPTGTVIRNRATIIFDANEPIHTDAWTNTADASTPSSHVLPLNALSPARFRVSWLGSDSGSGVMNYNIYASINGKPYQIWQANTDSTSAWYLGNVDSSYAFYSIALDSALNRELPPASADASTLVTGFSNQEISAGIHLELVPNPSYGKFLLIVKSLKASSLVQVLDISGRPVWQKYLNSSEANGLPIDVSAYGKGLYVIKLTSRQGTIYKRAAVE